MKNNSYLSLQSDSAGSSLTQPEPGRDHADDLTGYTVLLDPTLYVSGIKEAEGFPDSTGGHSYVWKAEMTRDGTMSFVALKVLCPYGVDPKLLHESFECEVRCWKKVSGNKNIAHFYGIYVLLNGLPAMVSPWYQNGTACDYLQQNPGKNPMEIIKGTADGLAHLHESGIVHGDVKGANILIDDNGSPRLIDFGLAHFVDSEGSLAIDRLFSVRWCAPELACTGATSTTSSDVYAFASTVLELLTGLPPYSTIRHDRVVLGEIGKGIRPPKPSNGLPRNIPHSEDLWRLLEDCWAESALRPSMQEVQLHLRDLYP